MKNKSILIRLNSNDYKMLEKEARKLKVSKSGLIRFHIRSQKTKKLITQLHSNKDMLVRMLQEISRIAGNINQIAYHLNSYQIKEQDGLELFLKEAQNTNNLFQTHKEYTESLINKINKVYQ